MPDFSTNGRVVEALRVVVFQWHCKSCYGRGHVKAESAATNVEEGIIPNSGHWVMEENPRATVAMVTAFLARPVAGK